MTPTAAFGTPEALAPRLATVEIAIRNRSTPDAGVDLLGREQQVLYRTLAARPEWQAKVIDAVPAEIRAAVQANLTADSELTQLGVPTDELPHWHIVAPAAPAVLVADYKAAEAASGVPWQYLAAIHLTETRMSRIRGNSSAGAQGPMQFLPATWSIYGAGGDINSDHDAILAAARLLKSRGAPENMSKALFAYNNSEHYGRPSPCTPTSSAPTNGPTSPTTPGRCSTATASSPRASTTPDPPGVLCATSNIQCWIAHAERQ